MFKLRLFSMQSVGLLVIFVTFFVTIVSPLNTRASDQEDSQACVSALSRRLFFQNSRLLDLAEYPIWSRLEYFFTSSSNWKIKGLFKKIGPQDFMRLRLSGLEQGHVRDRVVQKLITDLGWLYNKDPNIFWSKDDGQNGTLRGRILKRISEIKQDEVQRMGTVGVFGASAESSVSAVLKSEASLLAAAVEGNPRQASFVWRWVVPLYKPVLSIVEFNNYLMRESKMIRDVDNVVMEALEHSEELGLNADEVNEVKKTLEDSAGQMIDMQMLIADGYGVGVAKGQALKGHAVNVYEIATRIGLSNLNGLRNQSNQTALFDLDRLDRVLEKRAEKLNEDFFPRSKMKLVTLQTRYMIRDWAVYHLFKLYDGVMSRKPGIHYDDSWKERRTRTVGSGKDAKEEVYYVTVTETRYPTYENILNNDFYVRGTASGLSRIREESELFRQRELQLRGPIIKFEQLLIKISKSVHGHGAGPQELGIKIVGLGNQLKTIESQLKEIGEYAQLDRDQIKAQWVHDKVADFRDRNSALYHMAENQIRLARTIIELAARDQPLARNFEYPDRSVVLAELRDRWKKSRVSQGVLLVTAMTYGVSGLIYPEVFDTTLNLLDPILIGGRDLLGATSQAMSDIKDHWDQKIQAEFGAWIDKVYRAMRGDQRN